MPTAPCCWHLGRRRFALTGSSSAAMAQAKRLRAHWQIWACNEAHIVSPGARPERSIEALPKAPMELSAILLADASQPLGHGEGRRSVAPSRFWETP